MRILRACEAEGIDAVTVYSDADVNALWVRRAQESYRIGPPPVQQSYLNADALIKTALEARCDAVHPGYGLFSENAAFARRVQEAGLKWIGPSPEIIALMGVKTAARSRMAAASVPVVPGSDGIVESLEKAREIASEFGYPVMVKATSGGGGIGMELAADEATLERVMKGVSDRARRFFGGGDIYIEKAIVRPRHVEIQIFGDAHGNAVHLFERECSIQRRHQKVIEESPSPLNDPELIQRMSDAAVRAAQSVNYQNAGTVEFLVDQDRNFYFLEMNCRLQVEHPVTELVTGVDLVREQLRVAAGAPLSFKQSDIVRKGAAIELRLYAEDPAKNFLPSPGPIHEFYVPQAEGVRVDSGFESGDVITPYYDPLIAKLSFTGATRAAALDCALETARRARVGPLRTNLDFHRRVLQDETFCSGEISTQFINPESIKRLTS
ncbi:MAG: ATP-grasp domain-containing protein [Planctomycetes bacterium]|nr:ATP-grasp domain-containing protein [Planctomycetota bacterium]